MSSIANKRILKELKEFSENHSSSDSLLSLVSSQDELDNIIININIKDNELYDSNRPFTLSYKINKNYPFTPPQIIFIGNNIPIHPHIYSNGHICLNILYDNWTPVQTISSVVLSLQSMLINNKVLEKPPDDDNYCKHGPSDPLQAKWVFHDDTV
ncbi:hypothetical protein C6P40_000522 [Pichia californica]|uniref:UBC core domain-containing protein n=1 Tax=Pichia californica TaxID=460514 RepID=A0A9P6WKG9_9ASCO|nr:hypothetical protein C6P42_001422 [[Candida] californica]KAG0688791.1 hypothetical protein C6P40_000522 [[Candida] californica]